MDSYNSPTTKPLFRGTQIVWYFFSLLEALLAFRFIFKLMGANPEAGFTNFIYISTWPFTAPFIAVFPKTALHDSVFEWATLLAMLVYWMIAFAIVKLLLISKTVSTPEAAAKLDEQDRHSE
ncbi:MAG: YggT family protein [Candidatus Harrisonbacteria bacterium CG10_big_fil_rev_8_21_14_0_10_40_38]|uniref:YggT family protein n=1 Tax=Candidatus Harrisonbacteria bacterium CG10_big_fil_rev_8_21_14_0_10_40_38 TaxID=1974583 RepID=A0A2H0UU68_9BACT|nr:MAG: YggT family protein [Candidatus Harrisonbacteria bacterium CG10_big_fil_rev_8_21_14_0_10_40_38]